MMHSFPDIALGAIVAAIIAGTIALAGLIVGKENKTSEFRQAWIDALRAEVSEVIANATALYRAEPASADNPWEKDRAASLAFALAAAKIRMRLNPHEPPSKYLINILHDLEGALALIAAKRTSGNAANEIAVAEKSAALAEATSRILRADWRRVKSGEPLYQTALWFAGAMIAAGLLVLGLSPTRSNKVREPLPIVVEPKAQNAAISTIATKVDRPAEAGQKAAGTVKQRIHR